MSVILEALASGVSVFSSDCHAGPAEILADGSYGILVPVGDVQAIANAISKILLDPELAQTMETKGYQRAETFSVDRITEHLREILAELG